MLNARLGVASGQVFPRPGAAFGLQDKPREKREEENINTGCLRVPHLHTDQHKKHIGMLNNFEKIIPVGLRAVPPRGQGCKAGIYGQRSRRTFLPGQVGSGERL